MLILPGGLLLTRKLWRITHKLSTAQNGFMSSFWMIRQLTHRWSPQKKKTKKKTLISYNPNLVAEMVRFFTMLNFFGACGRKIVPRFLHRNLLKSKKFILFPSITLQKNRQNGGSLQYYKATSLFNKRRLSFGRYFLSVIIFSHISLQF